MDLSITRTDAEDEVVLTCAGRLDAETCDELARAVADELRRGVHAVRLDLADTGFLSSAGIRGLFDIQRAARAVGGDCLIRRASDTVRKVLDLTKLTPILMEGAVATRGKPALPAAAAEAVTHGPVRLVRHAPPAAAPLRGALVGSPDDALAGRLDRGTTRRLPRHAFAVGLGAIADGSPVASRAGELAAACGSVFHRGPHPHAAVDFMMPTADLLADVDLLAAVCWEGVPAGHAGFEPAGEEPSVRLDDLVEAVLAECSAETVGIVVAGEIHGLVGAELIRPLAAARDHDRPRSGVRAIVGSWLSFSREPVFAKHSAIIVGLVTRSPRGPLDAFVRRVPGRSYASHFHAVVFPFRPLRRGGADLPATVADLAASRPLSVMHLVTDPAPVLGSGRSELVRGGVWFGGLHLTAPEELVS